MKKLKYIFMLCLVLALMLGVANAKRQAFWIINAEGPDVTPGTFRIPSAKSGNNTHTTSSSPSTTLPAEPSKSRSL